MAIAFDAATDGGIVIPSTSLTWSHTCAGSDRVLRVGVRSTAATSDNVTGVTYNGVAMTLIQRIQGDTVRRALTLWELVNPDVGTHDVVVSGTSDVIMAESASYTGVPSAYDAKNTATNPSAASLGVDVTPVANNCWVQGVFGNNSGDSSAGAGTTERISSGNGIGLYDNNAAINPAALTTLTATLGGAADLVWIAASLVPTAAAARKFILTKPAP